MIRTKVIAFIIVISFIFSGLLVHKIFAFDCLQLTPTSTPAQKQLCQNELTQIEAQLADLLKKQQRQQKQTGTLKGDVDYLTAQINALKTKIKARSLAIAKLKVDINDKVKKINVLSNKIEKERQSLAQLLRNTNEFDSQNISYLILSDSSISEFYSDLESYNTIKKAIKTSVDTINGVKTETEVQKKDLEVKRDAETDAKVELESAQKKVAQSESEKKQLLAISKQKEASYQALANEKKARANKIRSALFSLAGVAQKIEFGTALDYANYAKQKTSIDSAFLLAIITQESNLGANVGSCYVKDTATGNGEGANTGTPKIRVMHPTRDIPIFMKITEKLGLDYSTTRVSCWQPAYTKSGAPSGWGGAMGPAQFIPSTWVGYTNVLKNILGHEANPWVPQDAFMASAKFLTDLGAVGNSASAQIRAACKYYGTGGSTCSYGRSVMKLKTKIQGDIDYINQYGVSKN